MWAEDGEIRLSFPKGAEIADVCCAFEDNGIVWWWGCYAGANGFFEDGAVELLDG